MVCTRCGAPTIDDLPFCSNCHHGADPRMFLGEIDPGKGVNGWLWVFVIILKYLNPLLLLISVLVWLRNGFTSASPIPQKQPILAFVNVLVVVFIAAFGIYVADNLKKIRPGAVRKAKQYLLFSFLYSVGWLLVVGGATLFHVVGTNEFRGALEGFIMDSAWLEIWYLYFTRSRRVAATYSTAPAHF